MAAESSGAAQRSVSLPEVWFIVALYAGSPCPVSRVCRSLLPLLPSLESELAPRSLIRTVGMGAVRAVRHRLMTASRQNGSAGDIGDISGELPAALSLAAAKGDLDMCEALMSSGDRHSVLPLRGLLGAGAQQQLRRAFLNGAAGAPRASSCAALMQAAGSPFYYASFNGHGVVYDYLCERIPVERRWIAQLGCAFNWAARGDVARVRGVLERDRVWHRYLYTAHALRAANKAVLGSFGTRGGGEVDEGGRHLRELRDTCSTFLFGTIRQCVIHRQVEVLRYLLYTDGPLRALPVASAGPSPVRTAKAEPRKNSAPPLRRGAGAGAGAGAGGRASCRTLPRGGAWGARDAGGPRAALARLIDPAVAARTLSIDGQWEPLLAGQDPRDATLVRMFCSSEIVPARAAVALATSAMTRGTHAVVRAAMQALRERAEKGGAASNRPSAAGELRRCKEDMLQAAVQQATVGAYQVLDELLADRSPSRVRPCQVRDLLGAAVRHGNRVALRALLEDSGPDSAAGAESNARALHCAMYEMHADMVSDIVAHPCTTLADKLVISVLTVFIEGACTLHRNEEHMHILQMLSSLCRDRAQGEAEVNRRAFYQALRAAHRTLSMYAEQNRAAHFDVPGSTCTSNARARACPVDERLAQIVAMISHASC